MGEDPNKKVLDQFYIEINGSQPQGLMDDLAEVVVDTTLHMPAMCTILLYDKGVKWIDNDGVVKIGNPVVIDAKAAEQGNRSGEQGKLFDGEITAIEPDYGENGLITLTIRAYTRDHRLHMGKKTRSFLQVTDSDIVKKIAGEAGLSVKADSTSVKYEYVLQNNQTDFEFILARAQRIGFQVFVKGKELYFQKANTLVGGTTSLEWGSDLQTFRPRLTSSQQDGKVVVKGWDPKTKKELVGQASDGKIAPETSLGNGTKHASVFGQAQAISVHRPVRTQDEAQAIANAIADEISGNGVRAEGRCFGRPGIVAGSKLELKNLGNRFSGTYYITAATHIYNSEEGYETVFSINGRKPNTLSHLLDSSLSSLGSVEGHARVDGVVVGLVTNNKDPEDMGRVKVKFPWLSDTDESHWARLVSPMAGPSRGIYYVPEVNDEVLVAFEHGDMNYPYIVGAVWNGKDKPPLSIDEAVKGGTTIRRLIKTRAGHQILLVDDAGKEEIYIVDKTGKNSIRIDSVKNDITILCDNNFTVEAKGKISMTSQMDFSFESKTGKVSGKGTSGMNLETPAQMTVKGSTTTVQASGPTTVKGNPIMLN